MSPRQISMARALWGRPYGRPRTEILTFIRRIFVCTAVVLGGFALHGCGHNSGSTAVTSAARAQAVHDIADGLARQQRRDYAGAIAKFNDALSADPNSAVAFYDRGAVEYRQAKYKAVVADFDRAIKAADHGSALTKDTRFYALLYGGLANEYIGDYAAAATDESAALKLRPTSVSAHTDRGFARTQRGDYHDAILDYRAAASEGGRSAQLYTLLGWSHIQTGDDRAAIGDFSRSIQRDKRYGLAYADRGVAEADLRAYDLAIADFTSALHLNGQDAWAFDQRCDSYNDLADYADAMYDCTRAIHLSPRFAEAFVDRSRADIGAGDDRNGIADATAAIRYFPAYAMAYNNRGYARQLVGDIRGAFADYAMALHFSPRLALALQNRNWLMSFVASHRGDPQWSGELKGLSTAMMEPAPLPTGSEYDQRVQNCGQHYESGSDYYSECMTWGLDSAQATENTDKEEAQAAVEDAQYAQAQAENDAAQAQENAQYDAADQQQAAQDAQDNADYSSSDTSSEPAPEPEAPSDDSGGG